jgi:hypothetical protein
VSRYVAKLLPTAGRLFALAVVRSDDDETELLFPVTERERAWRGSRRACLRHARRVMRRDAADWRGDVVEVEL